jgi:hypothetical protein
MGGLLSIIDFEMGWGVSMLGIIISTALARSVGRPSLSEPSRSLTRSLISSPQSSGMVSRYGSMAGIKSR